MPAGRLSTLARSRALYTGERYQSALEGLRGQRGPRPSPLPDASADQAFLESQILTQLCNARAWSAHPVGIARVQVYGGKATVIHLDSHVEFPEGGGRYAMAALALDHLLPYAEPGIQVGGITGLRVAGVHGTDLHLTLAGTESRCVIRAIPGTVWKEHLDKRWEALVEAGCPPLWSHPSSCTEERNHLASHRLVVQTDHDIAWLGSGLLRRIALFHTSSSAHRTRSWISDDEWVFELDTWHSVIVDHDTLLSRLTDPTWGLPLRIGRQHCECSDRPRTRSWHMRQCIYDLVHCGGLPCGLQLRFRWGPAIEGETPEAERKELRRLGADRAWLDRTLPVQERRPGVEREAAR